MKLPAVRNGSKPKPTSTLLTAGLSALVILQNLPQATSTATLQIQSFGRIAPIGGLYDARTVSFIPGSSVFQPMFRIPGSAIDSTHQAPSNTQLHVHPLDSTFSKFNEDNFFSQATILSILSEELKVYGSWRYLVEEPKGQSVRYKTELRRKWKREYDLRLELNRNEGVHAVAHIHAHEIAAMPHSVASHFSLEQLLAPQNINATHFVVGVSYGRSVTAIFQDLYKMRKYGMPEESDNTTIHPELQVSHLEPRNASQPTLKIVRLYTELHPIGGVDTLAELEHHFLEFENEESGDMVPLLYDIIPLTSILNYLNMNDTVRGKFAARWSPRFYIGDPPIEPHTMAPIYKEFDAVSIAQYRLNEAMAFLRDPKFEHVVGVRIRRQYLLRIQDLKNKFKYSLEMFKSHLRSILASYRLGKFNAGWTFKQAVNDTLTAYKRDSFSVENVAKILDTQFRGLHLWPFVWRK